MRAFALTAILAVTLSALVACSGAKSGNAANDAARTAASAAGAMNRAADDNAGTGKPNCGAVQPVWVNLNTKVYHQPGDPMYGKTKHGEYLCPSQASSQGFRPAGGSAKVHHHKTST